MYPKCDRKFIILWQTQWYPELMKHVSDGNFGHISVLLSMTLTRTMINKLSQMLGNSQPCLNAIFSNRLSNLTITLKVPLLNIK